MTRKIVRKRVGPEGTEIDCGEDADRWVDIKETTKATYERGRGKVYQKTIYTHKFNSQTRTYEDPPKIIFTNPDDESQTIPYLKSKGDNHGIIKSVWIECGRGKHYQKTKISYYNLEEGSTRQVREQRVENAETGDYIIAERIERWENEWGRGPKYQKKQIHPLSTEEQIDAMEGPCKTEAEAEA